MSSFYFKNIKGIILGGGRGTRLYPLTVETSKHLLPIGNKPMIVRIIDQLVEAGVKDVFLVIDERFASQFMATLKDGSCFGLNSLAYIWQPREGNGLPSAIARVQKLLQKNERIIVACGDVLVEKSLQKPIKEFMKQQDGARVVTTKVKDTAGYSPIVNRKDKVIKILSKDKDRHSTGLIDLGIYFYHYDVFKRIASLKPSRRGETEILDLNNTYLHEKSLFHSTLTGWWSDAGSNLKTYLQAHQKYESKN